MVVIVYNSCKNTFQMSIILIFLLFYDSWCLGVLDWWLDEKSPWIFSYVWISSVGDILQPECLWYVNRNLQHTYPAVYYDFIKSVSCFQALMNTQCWCSLDVVCSVLFSWEWFKFLWYLPVLGLARHRTTLSSITTFMFSGSNSVSWPWLHF